MTRRRTWGRPGRRRRPAALASVLVLLVALVAAACSSGDGGAGDASVGTGGATTAAPVAASPACDSSEAPASVEVISVDVGGTPRTSLVHLPAGGGGAVPVPVVVSFHGASSNAATMQLLDGLDATADAHGFVVLRPEGLPVDLSEDVVGVTGWDVSGQEVDEPAFVVALLDELGRRACIDPSRTYATGFSLGGDMAMALACALPDRIVAYASVGAGRTAPCDPPVPTPAVAFHGTDDLVVPYEGDPAGGTLGSEAIMAEQAQRNGCTGGPETVAVGATVATLTWTGCDAPTVLYRLAEHGHAWPGRPLPADRDLVVATLGGTPEAPNPIPASVGLTPEQMADNVLLTNTDVDGNEIMWELFSQSA